MEGCQGTLHTNRPVRGATGAFWCQERMQPSEHVRMHELSVDVWPVAAALLTLFVWTLISDFSVSFTMLPHHLETDPSLVLPWGWEWANQPSYFRSQRCPQTAAPKSLSKLTFSIDYYWRHTYSCIPPASSLQDSRHLVFLATQLIKIVQTPYHIKRVTGSGNFSSGQVRNSTSTTVHCSLNFGRVESVETWLRDTDNFY